jgi:hypothetical protein
MNKFESSVKRSLERSRSGNANKGRTTGSAARSAISALRGKLKTSQTTEDIVIFAGPRSQTAEHPNGGAASNESAPENNYRSGDSTPKDYDTENPAAMDYENDKNNDYSSQQHQQLIDNSLMMMVPAGAEGDESFMNMSMPSFSHADDFNVSFAISKVNCSRFQLFRV